MINDFLFSWNPWVLPAVMFVLLGFSIELPYRFAKYFARDASKDDAWNTVQTGLITLAAFVLGLSFAQAAGRFDARRALVVKEANAIGTTWLRAAQLPPADAAKFRQVLTDYTAARLKAYETPNAPDLYRATIDQGNKAQSTLWEMTSSSLHAHPTNLGLSLLMQTLNDTIDVSSEQLAALRGRVPTAMLLLTLVLVTLGTLAIGIRFARDGARPALMSAVFVVACVVVACVVVISMVVDYDRPQTGFVTVSLAPLRDQLQSMQPPR
jgi:hypothetical protein